ncbi:DUF5957 family protein [Halobacillus hunanensis]|uniref:DUF5957 family protein n=1 Tax=Halobacillus hunanensis TaxID=578214 RepID=UPI003CCBBFCB
MLITAIAGFIAGIVVSEFIGMMGYLLFDQSMGVKYLPIVFAIVFACIGPSIDRRFIRVGTRK